MTSAFIFLVQSVDSIRLWASTNIALYIVAAILSIVFACMIICCFGRQAPINYALLLGFTVCETYMVGGLTAAYDPKTVMMAGLATALTTIALTIYALKTKTKVEVFMAMSFVVYLAMLPLVIISLVIGLGPLNTLYCALGVVLYGLFLIIDTMMICRGTTMSGYGCDFDDYIIGAMMLYIDIVMLFVYLLRLFGNNN